MANKRLFQFLYSKHPMLSMINCAVNIGAAGAVSSVEGAGVQGVTHLGTGIYQVKLQDNWYEYVMADANVADGVTGAAVADGSFVSGTLYQIVTVGDTDWAAAGFDSDYTAAVGSLFVATGAGGAGTGTAKAIGASGILAVAIAQDQGAMLKNLNASQGKGSSFIISCYDASGVGGAATLADPASGSQIQFRVMIKNSSVASI